MFNSATTQTGYYNMQN